MTNTDVLTLCFSTKERLIRICVAFKINSKMHHNKKQIINNMICNSSKFPCEMGRMLKTNFKKNYKKETK